MKCVVALMALSLALAVAQAADPVKGSVHHAKPASTGKPLIANSTSSARLNAKSTKRQHTVASSGAAASRSSRRARSSRSRVARAVPSYQTHPDPARYQEIQKALADRGYLKTEPNGLWDNDSIDALKRFQADQQLDTDGKINARTLMGLGLGPKHDGNSVASAVAPQVPQTPQTDQQDASPQ